MSVAPNYLILNTETKLNHYTSYIKDRIGYIEEYKTIMGWEAENEYDYNLEAALVARCRSEGCLQMDTDITEDF